MTTTSVAANPVRAKLTVPGPRPMPLLGSAGNMMGFISDPVAYTTKLFKEYGPVVALSANGGTNFYTPEPDCPGSIFIYGPELIRQATTQHEIYYKYPLTGKLYAKRNQTARTEPLKHFLVGLFGVNSDEHRQHRRMLMPAFHKKRIETYRDDMVRLTQSTLDSLKIREQCNIAASTASFAAWSPCPLSPCRRRSERI